MPKGNGLRCCCESPIGPTGRGGVDGGALATRRRQPPMRTLLGQELPEKSTPAGQPWPHGLHPCRPSAGRLPRCAGPGASPGSPPGPPGTSATCRPGGRGDGARRTASGCTPDPAGRSSSPARGASPAPPGAARANPWTSGPPPTPRLPRRCSEPRRRCAPLPSDMPARAPRGAAWGGPTSLDCPRAWRAGRTGRP